MGKTVILAICILYCLLLLGLSFIAWSSRLKEKAYIPMKMVTSAGFLVTAYVFGYLGGSENLLLNMLPGLLCCFIGDYFMGRYNRLRKKYFIGLGIGFFMLAHVCFLVYLYWLDARIEPWDVLLPLAAVPICLTVAYVAHLHLGKLRLPAAIYSAFVMAFMVKSVHYGLANFNQASSPINPVITAIAGILFFASDFSLLFLYFYHYHNKNLEKGTHLFNLITYYISLLLFTLTLAI